MALELGARLTTMEMRELADMFSEYMDRDDALVWIRTKLERVYDRRPSLQRVIMEHVLEHSEGKVAYELTKDFRLEPTAGVATHQELGGLIGEALGTSAEPPKAMVIKHLPEADSLVRLNFGPPFVDLGNGIGATCGRCAALVVEEDGEEGLLAFRFHYQDHQNIDRAIIGAAGDQSQERGRLEDGRAGGN
jgi:hypothetical protein